MSTLSSANVTDVNLVLKERTHMPLCINILIFTHNLGNWLIVFDPSSSDITGDAVDTHVHAITTVVIAPAAVLTMCDICLSTTAVDVVQPNPSSTRTVDVTNKPSDVSACIVINKMLSYCRETALQGALVLAKSRRLELGDNICGHCRSIFNHCDTIVLQSYQIQVR